MQDPEQAEDDGRPAPAPATVTARPSHRQPDRSVVLVGMMGAGKTSVGKRLAHALGLAFVDADDEIVAAARMSIAEMFERFGEAHFRDGERRVIARMLDGPPRVIATGGGAFVDPSTRALLLSRAVCVWLDAGIDTLVERVGRSSHRPLLRGRDARTVLTELLAARRPAYAEAHIRVESLPGPHAQVVTRIVEALDALSPRAEGAAG